MFNFHIIRDRIMKRYFVKKMYFLSLFTALFTTTACVRAGHLSDLSAGLYGIIETSKGIVVLQLYYTKTPMTVSNFVGLANGAFEGHHPYDKNYYDGLTFHRVIADFVVQGGDPHGDGTGGPGYNFADEIDTPFVFDAEGVLAMANSGQHTNGSQFFITLGAATWLNGKHTIFGKVVKGMNVVRGIEQGDEMISVSVKAKGNEASNFLKKVSWDTFTVLQSTIEDKIKKQYEENQELVRKQIFAEEVEFEKTNDGMYFVVQKRGFGKPVEKGNVVLVDYELKIYGKSHITDSSIKRGKPIEVTVGNGEVIKGWDSILQQMVDGEKRRVIIPPELAYGARSVGGVIPPHSFLEFEIEIIEIK